MFLAGFIGLSMLSFLGLRSGDADTFTDEELRELLHGVPAAQADFVSGGSSGPADPSGSCPSGGDGACSL